MSIVTLVTNNPSKYSAFGHLLDRHRINLEKREIQEIQSLDLDQVVTSKAISAFNLQKSFLMVDEAALFLDAYPRFPATMTKFILETIGLSGLKKLVADHNATGSLACRIACATLQRRSQ